MSNKEGEPRSEEVHLPGPGEGQDEVSGVDPAPLSGLGERLEKSLEILVPEQPRRRFSERGYLVRMLRPYLEDYPFLATDFDTLSTVRDLLRTPLEIPDYLAGAGVFDCGSGWAMEERRNQIKTVLEQAQRESQRS